MANDYQLLRRIRLGPTHCPTGRTRHYADGVEIGAPAELRIVVDPEAEGFYLLGLDASGAELTDTFHMTLAEALGQANWEFEIDPSEWEVVAETPWF